MIDLAVIGAGPAGMAAALAAHRQGMHVVVIDNRPDAGGQILRRPPGAFSVTRWLTDRIYRPLHKLYDDFNRAGIDLEHRCNTEALGLSRSEDAWELALMTTDGLEVCTARRVVVASGCFDMPVSFDGAQLPGVMATGGLQAFVKSQQIIPGDRLYFHGTHPLQLLVAQQMRKAGARVVGVAFEQPFTQFLSLSRQVSTLSRQLPNLTLLLRSIIGLVMGGVKIRFGTELVAARGSTHLEQVLVRAAGQEGDPEVIDCDRLGICFSFLTNNDLVRLAGAETSWSQTRGGWIANHDSGMRSSLPGLYVAGETTGVGGANVARFEGELAGLSAALDSDNLDLENYHLLSRQLGHDLEAARQFAELLAEVAFPGDRLSRLMTDSACLCKCEELTVGSARDILRTHLDITDLSALKLMTRCGMGHCQGRYCHYQARWLMAQEREKDASELGGFTARFPIKPTRLGDLTEKPRD
jgi:thioredoxin reductase